MPGTSLKVLTYNIHKGFSAANLRFILHEIKSSLRHINADVVFLQEVHGERHMPRNHPADQSSNRQFEFLADQVWQHYAYGKNAIYKNGHHGNAILSKHPFIEWENINVSLMKFASRSLLHGIIQVPGVTRKIHMICVHFGLFSRERELQLAALVKRINSHVPFDDPLIIAGDFNDWQDRAAHYLQRGLGVEEIFKSMHGSHARTFPAWLPILSMDRIYYRNLNAVHCHHLRGQPWHNMSDHTPLLAEFELI